MRIEIRGRNVEMTEDLRELVNKRFSRLNRQVSGLASCEVVLYEERNPSIHEQHLAEATIFLKGSTLRASESAVDMQVAIDRLHENLERQVRRYREKRREEPRRHGEHHQT